MWLSFVLAWLYAIFAANGHARPLDIAELLVYNTGHATPPSHLIYTSTESTLSLNFFVASEQSLLVGNTRVRVSQRTDYPASGEVEVRIEPDARAIFTVAIRTPSWARGELIWSDRYRFELPDVSASTMIVNAQAVGITFDRGFAKVTREWRSGDVIHIYFPMPLHQIIPRDTSCKAVQRGPLIWCAR